MTGESNSFSVELPTEFSGAIMEAVRQGAAGILTAVISDLEQRYKETDNKDLKLFIAERIMEYRTLEVDVTLESKEENSNAEPIG